MGLDAIKINLVSNSKNFYNPLLPAWLRFSVASLCRPC